MKRLFLSCIATLISLCFIGCGGGSGSSPARSSLSGKTTVALHVGQPSSTAGNRVAGTGALAIPPNVSKIVFTISGPDIPTSVMEFPVSGRSSFTASFSIQNGNDRFFLAEAEDTSGNILYSGSTTANLNGSPVTLTIFMTAVDNKPPTVISTDPSNNATGVPVATAITVTFSKSMDPSSFVPGTFTLKAGAAVVPGTVNVQGSVMTFAPSAQLAFGTSYTATVTKGVKDLTGNALAADYSWTFATGAGPDKTPPTVVAVSPANGAIDVPVTSNISATFSKHMDPSTLTTETFLVTGGNTGHLSGVVAYSGNTATFTPSQEMAHDTTYSATITTGATDTSGNALERHFDWTFTTEGVIDLFARARYYGSLDVTVGNQGTVAASDILVFVMYELEGPYCESFSISSLAPFAAEQFSIPYVYSSDYFVIVDPFESIQDSDRSNNTACGGSYCSGRPSFSICPSEGGIISPQADLSVGSAAISGPDVNFTINNTGSADANNAEVYVLWSDFYSTYCSTFSFNILAGGSVSSSVSDVSPTAFYIVVDPNNLISESNESNNTACSGFMCSSPPALDICGG
ncbi:MAG: Ig-like domain-containing protein [Nitrospirae bacterium]|nr:Ig-like domain-containing protein [Nitrospirota bacterium]